MLNLSPLVIIYTAVRAKIKKMSHHFADTAHRNPIKVGERRIIPTALFHEPICSIDAAFSGGYSVPNREELDITWRQRNAKRLFHFAVLSERNSRPNMFLESRVQLDFLLEHPAKRVKL